MGTYSSKQIVSVLHRLQVYSRKNNNNDVGIINMILYWMQCEHSPVCMMNDEWWKNIKLTIIYFVGFIAFN